jgi:hypothetical protein
METPHLLPESPLRRISCDGFSTRLLVPCSLPFSGHPSAWTSLLLSPEQLLLSPSAAASFFIPLRLPTVQSWYFSPAFLHLCFVVQRLSGPALVVPPFVRLFHVGVLYMAYTWTHFYPRLVLVAACFLLVIWLLCTSTLKMEAVRYSDTSVNFYRTIQYQISETTFLNDFIACFLWLCKNWYFPWIKNMRYITGLYPLRSMWLSVETRQFIDRIASTLSLE